MAFALKLFKITIYNTYYQAGVGDSNDFGLEIAEESKPWMERYRMKLVASTPGCVELHCAVSGLENPLHTLKEKLLGQKLTFHLRLKNQEIVSLSELNVAEGKTYYFQNTSDALQLHQGEYLSGEDQIPIVDQPAATDVAFRAQPPIRQLSHRPLWGVIDIYLDKLWEKSNLSEKNLPIDYAINIKARESIWRYSVIDRNSRLKSPIKVVCENKKNYFGGAVTSQNNGTSTHLFASKKPIAFQDRPTQCFSLQTYTKNDARDVGETVMERLPFPTSSSLSREKEKGGVFYSDVFVYI